jgi:hypothetical protein
MEFSIPVGSKEYLYLSPMTFEEYLLAKNENQLLEILQGWEIHSSHLSHSSNSPQLQHPFHEKFLNHVRDFSFIGGMPEIVQNFTACKSSFQHVFGFPYNCLTFTLNFPKLVDTFA